MEAIAQGHGCGFEIMRAARLPSGTAYPLLRRPEASGLLVGTTSPRRRENAPCLRAGSASWSNRLSSWDSSPEAPALGRMRRHLARTAAAVDPVTSLRSE